MNRRTILWWWARFRRVCVDYFAQHPIHLGGSGNEVEIDETFLTTRKAQRGRRVCHIGRWIFGGTERRTNASFMVLVHRRRAVDLLPQIQRFVNPGSTIYSGLNVLRAIFIHCLDEWKAYRGIVRLPMWLLHRRVRHSQHFVDPITHYHTQNIERKWGELKAVFREKKGIHDKQLKNHITEFLWRERFGKTREVFYNFWAHIAELYPCH